MRKLLIFAFVAAFTLCAHAVPALKKWRNFTQSDGTQVSLMLTGDENLHYYKTTDGLVVVQDENENYVYAKLASNGLAPSTILAHNVEMRTAEEQSQIAALGDVAVKGVRLAAAQKPHFAPTVGEPTGNFEGSKKGLIIMVDFSDLDFVVSKQDIDDMVNKVGYTNSYGAIGSVHDYFNDMSNGVFDLTFDVVGPVKLQRKCYYYGYNQGGGDSYNRVVEFVTESILAAADSTDFTKYDWDGDGEVDQVFLLYAGYGEATGGHANTIWPHESHLMSPLTIDGMKVATYACSNELNGNSGETMMGLGVVCHEFTHCLGLPDFYDTATNGEQYGMDMWDLMSSGSYNADSWIPAGYTGYERHFCGWREYRKLDSPCKVDKLEPLNNGGETYQIVNPGNENEYFLLENRHGKYSWDKGLYPVNGSAISGLMIYHVTYDAERWRQNKPNATGYDYQCMTPVHADNSDATTFYEGGYYYVDPSEYQGDLFPYRAGLTDNHNFFSDESVPADALNTPNSDGSYLLHTDVSNIRKQSRFSFFTFMDGTQPWSSDGIQETVSAGTEGLADVYTVDGRIVRSAVDEAAAASLPHGMYVMRYANGQSRKVIIK